MPAQYKSGTFARATDPRSRQCQHVNAADEQCRAWALRGELLCRLHSMSDDERKAQSEEALRVRRAKATRRRAVKDALRQGQAVPIDRYQEALDRLAATQAKLEQLHAEGRISDAEMPLILRPAR